MVFEDYPGAGYLRLRGLPFNATAADIASFFDGYDLSEDQVLLGINHEGRPSGEAWVQFADNSTAEMARNHKDRQQIGSRYIEIFQSSYEDCKFVRSAKLSGGAPASKSSGQTLKNVAGAGYLRLRGLPFYAGANEVAEFFSDYGVGAGQVVMGVEGATGRPSGEAWVQFASEEVASEARAAKDRQRMGTRYIEVFMSSEDEASKAGSRPTQDSRYRAADSGSKGYGKGMAAAMTNPYAMGMGMGMGMNPMGMGMMGMGKGSAMDWSAWGWPMAWGYQPYSMSGKGSSRYQPY